MTVKALYLKVNDLQPYYYAQVKDSNGSVVSLAGATIRCTMRLINSSTLKINRQTTGINVTDAANGMFEYRWQVGDTDTIGKYYIEFEISPVAGGKFTVPSGVNNLKHAEVNVVDSLDAQ